jgi:hypothetical protein
MRLHLDRLRGDRLRCYLLLGSNPPGEQQKEQGLRLQVGQVARREVNCRTTDRDDRTVIRQFTRCLGTLKPGARYLVLFEKTKPVPLVDA